jgi:2-succinyl-5-enolpyruvyl-6-hydroxy-3-cyclohexene-1-carboxylate synthase
MSFSSEEYVKLHWDICITIGYNFISRKIKTLVRNSVKEHWSIQWHNKPIDLFRLGARVLQMPPADFLNSLCIKLRAEGRRSINFKKAIFMDDKDSLYFSSRPFSDLKFFYWISKSIPSNSIVQMGNSSVVRYFQLFQQKKGVLFFGNRGVSGIDGCTSTAVGAACASDKTVVFVTGDLAFLYDINALWIQNWPKNLKVVIINNGGGGIFKIIEGAKNEKNLLPYFETPHARKLDELITAFGYEVKLFDQEEGIAGVSEFLIESDIPFLIVNTDDDINPKELDLFFENLKIDLWSGGK